MTEYQEDPFAEPLDIPSEFPSAASFRGRLVLIQPTNVEWNRPKDKEPGKFENRVTATVTVVDGSGDVELMPQQVPSGTFVPGPVYSGIWFAQERVVGALVNMKTRQPLPMVLGRLQTFKPGPAKQGNPWGLIRPTEDDKQTAREFLAKQAMEQATAKVAQATGQEDESPF